MSSESDIAKAIREHTAYHKHVIDSIVEIVKFILIGLLIAIIVVSALIVLIPVLMNYLYPQHYGTAPPTVAQLPSQIESGYNASMKIDEYHQWCMKNYQSWIKQGIDTLPYCTNQYGEKIHP